jgi:hypothetical protein
LVSGCFLKACSAPGWCVSDLKKQVEAEYIALDLLLPFTFLGLTQIFHTDRNEENAMADGVSPGGPRDCEKKTAQSFQDLVFRIFAADLQRARRASLSE